MTNKEEQALDNAARVKSPFNSTMQAAKSADPASMNPSQTESAVRGLGSGVLMGFEPQVAGAVAAVNPFTKETYSSMRDSEANRNEQAWQTNPVSYGAGYTAGAVGSTALGMGAVGGAIKGASGALKAGQALDAGALATGKAMAADASSGALNGALNAAKQPVANTLKNTSVGSTLTAVPGLVVRQQGETTNSPTSGKSSDASSTMDKPGMFSSIANFLSQAKDSSNPAVQQQAQLAQQQLDEQNDADAKRRIAMNLQTTQEGRAVGNSESPVNGDTQEA